MKGIGHLEPVLFIPEMRDKKLSPESFRVFVCHVRLMDDKSRVSSKSELVVITVPPGDPNRGQVRHGREISVVGIEVRADIKNVVPTEGWVFLHIALSAQIQKKVMNLTLHFSPTDCEMSRILNQ